ncbi:MAG: DNA polymerase III subunit epsilon [Rhodobacter sp.]|uniref:3'-5' exonuclease n=1 Tax=Pararhodobacter sp. TaxID=2127056 RepID=UPI001D5EE030|nr:exonuclease domain-containing protein [Pararhodobacter sp.]MCB1344671.1 DNA polymerase III subunit epsilon [Paracoccaceae bacterium]MCB1408105.1 DNA polymerase III subunit epsilon [Paracoccaceae bacterium]MCC0073092.1 DNA polymerase III subunit epsilon [Rhodobacter sp.]HPD92888.1 exonuclease domain-containing protein [Pararhodobacter sp.]
MLDRLSLRLRILLFFAALALGAVLAIVAGLWVALRHEGAATVPPALVSGGLIAAFLVVGLVTWVWFLFDQNVARAIESLASAIRARVHAGIEHDLVAEARAARYLGDLAPAAAAVTRTLVETRNALAESVARETTRLAAEKSRLETLLADVPVAVLLCTADHQLAFYNGQAVDILGGGTAPGLDRNLLDYLRAGPIRHAYDRLAGAGDPDLASDLLCATATGGRLLAGRMRVLRRREEGIAPGYVLTLRDVTADIAAHTSREALLAEVFDRVRRPAANLQTVIGVLAELQDAQDAPDLSAAMLDEVGALTQAITELGARYDAAQSDWRPLVATRSADLLDGLKGRLQAEGLSLETEGPELILQVDGFEIVAFWAWLACRLAEQGTARAFRLVLAEEDGPGAVMRLCWDGAPLSVGRLDGWLIEPLGAATGELSARAVLKTHATEAWPEQVGGRSAVVMPIRSARRAGRRPPPIARKVVYDFDLLSKARNAAVADTRLDDLTFVVFDTETTGLSPATDEIVQIAGVRLVNGKRVETEVFDTLVNPGRPIPPSSTDVHGINDSMVVGAPDIVEAGRRFHKFAEGAVLVAHNAPFDMEFLRRKEAALGVAFDHPILDTVLLSAVVYGQTEQHSLDALTARLGITIPEEARHTAIGDTVATADAFLKLVPMLRARGLDTFGAVVAEVRKHGRLLKDLNG